MAEIKAIETIYNGYRFRSRLEARWAVFMDTLHIKYEYEPEGFDLGDGYYYLPDFYLPYTDTWMEVKGKEPTKEETEKMIRFAEAKCDFVNGGSKFRLLQDGIPDYIVKSGKYFGIPCYNFLSVDECKLRPYKMKVNRGILYEGIWIPTVDERGLQWAILQARRARFEHGECGYNGRQNDLY